MNPESPLPAAGVPLVAVIPPSADIDSRDDSDDFDDVFALPPPPPSFRRPSGTTRRSSRVAAAAAANGVMADSVGVSEQFQLRRGGGVSARDRNEDGGNDVIDVALLLAAFMRDRGSGGDDEFLVMLLLDEIGGPETSGLKGLVDDGSGAANE